METLEQRQLLAITPALVGSTAIFNGNAAADTLYLRAVLGVLQWSTDGVAWSADLDQATAGVNLLNVGNTNARIQVSLRDGADRLLIQSSLQGAMNSSDSFEYDGGGGVDELVGPNQANAWRMTGPSGGNLNGLFSFTNTERFVGGTADDEFAFDAGINFPNYIGGQEGLLTLRSDRALTLTGTSVVTTRVFAPGGDPATAPSTGASGDLVLRAPSIVMADNAKLLSFGNSGFLGGDITLTAAVTESLSWLPGLSNFQIVNSSARIDLGAVTVSGRNIRATALAVTTKTAILTVNLPAAAADPLGQSVTLTDLLNFNTFAATVLVTATADVLVGAGATLRADDAVFLNAAASSTAVITTLGRYLGVTYASSAPTANVVVAGGTRGTLIEAGGEFAMDAVSNNALDVQMFVPSTGDDVNVSVAYGQARSKSQSWLQSGVRVASRTARVQALNINDFSTVAVAAGYQLSGASGLGSTVTVGDYDSEATARVDGEIRATGTVLVLGRSSNVRNQTRGFGTVSSQPLVSPLVQTVDSYLGSLTTSEQVGDRQIEPAPGLAVGRAAAVVIAGSDSRAFSVVGANATIQGGNIRVEGKSDDTFQSSASSSAGDAASVAMGGSVLESNVNNQADASVGKSARLDASGNIEVQATASQRQVLDPPILTLDLGTVPAGPETFPEENKLKYGTQVVARNVRTATGPLTQYLTSLLTGQTPQVTTFVHTGNSVQPSGAQVVGGTLNQFDARNVARAWVDTDAMIGVTTAPRVVTVEADSVIQTSNVSGVSSTGLSRVEPNRAKVTVGGSLQTINYDVAAEAWVDDNTIIKSVGEVNVEANSDASLISMTRGGQNAIDKAVNGTVLMHLVRNRAIAHLEESVAVTARDLRVRANQGALVLAAAGVVGVDGGITVGIAFASNDVDTAANAFLGHANTTVAQPGTITVTNVFVTSVSNVDLWALSVAGGALGDAEKGTGGETEIDDEGQIVPVGGGGRSFGFGLSADVGMNFMRNESKAFVRGRIKLVASSLLDVLASSDLQLVSAAGAVANATYGGLGGAYGHNELAETVHAFVEGAQVESATVRIDTEANQRVVTFSAGGSSTKESAAVAGSVNLNRMVVDNRAFLDAGASIVAPQGVFILASQNGKVISVAGALALDQKFAAGAAVDLDTLQFNTVAEIGRDVTLKTGALELRTAVINDVCALSASLASSSVVGVGAAGSAAYLQMVDVAAARIGENASIDATGNIVINSTQANFATVVVGAQSVGLSGVGAAVALTDINATSSIAVASRAKLQSASLLRLDSLAKNGSSVVTFVPTVAGAEGGTLALSSAKAASHADVQTASLSSLKAATVRVVAENDPRYTTQAIAAGYQLARAGVAGVGLALAFSDHDTSARALAGGIVSSAGEVRVHATSTNRDQLTRALGSVQNEANPVPQISGLQQIEDTLAGLSFANEVAGRTMDASGSGSVDLAVAAAVALGFSDNQATAAIGPGAEVTSPTLVDIVANATDGFRASATGTAGEAGKAAVGGAASVQLRVNKADALVDNGAVVNAGQKLNVLANAIVPSLDPIPDPSINLLDADSATGSDRVLEEYSDGQTSASRIAAGLGQLTPFVQGLLASSDPRVTTYAHSGATVASGGLATLAFSVNWLDVDNVADAHIGPSARINTVGPAGNVSVYATGNVSTIDLAGQTSTLSYGGMQGGATGFGGSFNGVHYDNRASAHIDDGATVKAADLELLATTQQVLLSVVQAGTFARSASLQGAVGFAEIANTTTAYIEDEAIVESASDVDVDANHSALILNIAGGLAVGGNAGVGVSAAFNDVHNTTRAFIGDSNASTGALGAVTAKGRIGVEATSDSEVWNSSFAGSGTAVTNWGAGGELEYEGLEFGFGVSGDTAVHAVNSTVEAFIKDAGTITAISPNPQVAPGLIEVKATQNDLIVGSAGAVATARHVGIGGSFVWLPMIRRTHAYTQGVALRSDLLQVRSRSREDLAIATAGGSGARRVASLAGSANLLQVQNDTQAYLGNRTDAVIRGEVEVLADQRTDGVSTAGAVADVEQGFLAVGAALDRPEITQNVQAYSASTASLVADGHVRVLANTDENVRSIATSTAKATAAGEPNRTYLNDGTASPFSAVAPRSVAPEALHTSSSALGDLDGDGDLDLVVGTLEGFNRRYLNDGTGRFGTGLAVGTDLLLGVAEERLPDPDQVANSALPDSTTSVALFDANGDGRPDLLAGNLVLPSRLYINLGDGRFLPGQNVTEAGRATMAVAVGDVDKDGLQDFVTANLGSTSRLYLGRRGGKFAEGVDISTDVLQAQAVVLGDVTGDGWLDLVVGSVNAPNRLYRNNGAGGFLPGVDLAGSGTGTTSLALGDVDGDGDLDLVAGHLASPTKLHRNNAGALATGANISPDLRLTQKVVLADMTGDGRLDILTANSGTTNRLYRGTGGGAFAAGQNIGSQEDFTRTISVGDLNRDSRPDVVVGNFLPATGVAGSVSAPQFSVTTQAFVQANGVVSTKGSLLVDAQDRLRLVALAGASAGGRVLGVGISAANPVVARTNQAFLGDNARVTALGQGAAMADPQDAKLTFRGMLISADTSDDLLNYAAGNAEAQDAALNASAIYTDAQTRTDAYIGAGAIVNGSNAGAVDQQSVLLDASHVSTLLSIAGTVARSQIAAVGAAGDLSELDHRVSAYVGGSAQVTARNHVLGTATSNGTIVSVTRGTTLADVASIAGSLSLVVADTRTSAHIDANATVSADGNVLMMAESLADYATFAGTKAQDAQVGIGASHTGVFKSDVTEAYVSSAARVHARALRDASDVPTGDQDPNGAWRTRPLRGVGVIAVSSERLSPVTVSGQQAALVGMTGVAGSVNLVVLDERTRAEVGSGAIINPLAANANAGLGQSVYVLAVDNTQLQGLAGARSEAAIVGVAPSVDVSDITKSTQAILGGTVEARSDIYVQAFARDRVASLPSTESLQYAAAIAGAASLSTWNVTTEAFTRDNAAIHTPGSLLVWADGQGLLDVMAGGGNASLVASVGASLGASIFNKVTRAYIGAGGAISAEGKLEPIPVPNGEFVVTFTAQPDKVMEVDVPGSIGVIRDVLALVFDNPIRDVLDPLGTPAPEDDLSLKNQRAATPKKVPWQGLAVTATSQDDAEIQAAGYGASIAGVAQGSGAVAVFNNSTAAFVDAGARVNSNQAAAGTGQGVLVAAGSDASYLGIAGVAAGGVANTAGAGASAVMVNNTTQSYIGNAADVRAKRLVQVVADATEDVLAIGVSANATARTGLAAALALVSLDTKTHAFIDDNAAVSSAGNVLVSASDDTDSDVLSGGALLGLRLNVGASLGVTLIEKDTRAFVDANARVDALATSNESIATADSLDEAQVAGGVQKQIKGLVVQAVSSEHVTSMAGAGAISLGLVVSGAGAISVLDSNTVAFIGAGAKINESTPSAGVDQSVHVGALNKARVFGIAANIQGGGGGLAGAIDLGILRNDTSAYVAAGALVNARKDVLVLANASKDIDSFVGGAGVTSDIGVQGSVSLYSLGASLDDDSRDLLLSATNADTFQGFVDNTIASLLNSGGGAITQFLAAYSGFLDASTQEAADTIDGQAPSGAVTAALDSTLPYQGTTASVNGASINAGRDVVVRAVDATDALADTTFTFAFGIGQGLNVNVDAGRINSSNHAEAFASAGARIRAGRDVRLLAQQSNGQEVVATVAFNNMEDTVRAYTDNADIEAGQLVAVDAESKTTADYRSLMPGLSSLRVRSAINEVDNRVEASARNRSVLKAFGGNVLVHADESSSLIVHAVVVTIPAILGNGFGVGAAAASNDIHNTVLAYVENAVLAAPVGSIDIGATSTPTIEAVAVGAAGAEGLAVGGSVALNDIGNVVEAYVRANGDVQAVGSVQVRATNLSTLQVVTGGAAGSAGPAVGAAVSDNRVSDQIKAWADQSLVKSTTGEVALVAKSTPLIDSLAIGGAGAAQRAAGGSVTFNKINNVVDAHASNGAILTGAQATRIVALEDRGRIRALSGGGAGAVTAGVGAALATNDIGSQVTGWVEAAAVTATDARGQVLVSGSTNTSIQTFTIGGAGAAGYTLGGSVSLNDMRNTVHAHVGLGATLTAPLSVAVQASDASKIEAIAGGGAGAGTAAVGASFSTNRIRTGVVSWVDNSTISGAGNSIDVTATTADEVFAITVGGAGAGTFALGGAVSLNEMRNTVDAHISGRAQMNQGNRVRVQSNDNSSLHSIAGSGAGAGVVSVGASVATNDIQTRGTAFVETASIVAGSLEVTATAEGLIETIAAGLAGAGTVAATGGVSWNRIRNQLDAHVAGAATITTTNKAQVSASNQSTIKSFSGQASGAGAAGIGGAGSYNEINGTTLAYIENAAVTSLDGDVLLTSYGLPTIETKAIGGNGGVVGVAGSVGVNLIESMVEARIRLASVTAFGSVLVQADSGDTIDAAIGSFAGGIVGVGGSVVSNLFKNQTKAFVDASTVVARGRAAGLKTKTWNASTGAEVSDELRGLGIIADSRETLSTSTVSAGAGVVGVSANVAVNNFKNVTEAYLDNSRVNSLPQPGGEVVVRAHQLTDVNTGGGVIAGGVVGVGAGVHTTLVENQTRAFITDSDGVDRTQVFSGLGAEVTAFSNEGVGIDVVGAGVGLVPVAGSVATTLIDVDTEAFIGAAILRVQGDLDVTARDLSSIDLLAGTVGLGTVGVGASVIVNDIDSSVRAYLSESETNASGRTKVLADSSEVIKSSAASAGAGVAGVAGSVVVSSIATQTRAFTTAARSQLLVNQDVAFAGEAQDVVVRANDRARIEDTAGAATAGVGGAGSSVSVATIKNVVEAEVGTSSRISAARKIDVTATSDRTIDTQSVSFSAGGLGIQGSVAVASIGAGLDSRGASEVNGVKGVVNPAIDQSAGLPNVNANDPVAARARSMTATNRYSINDDLATGAAPGDTSARVNANAILTAGDDVNVLSDANSRLDLYVPGVSAGFVGVGGSVAIGSVDSQADARVAGGARIRAADDVNVIAGGHVNNSRVASFAGGAGGVGLGAAVAFFDSTNNAIATVLNGARIEQAADLRIAADASSQMIADGLAGLLGGTAIGVALGEATEKGVVEASLADGAIVGDANPTAPKVGNLVVKAGTNHEVAAQSSASTAGLVGAGTNVSTAEAAPTLRASVGDVDLFLTGNLEVEAASAGNVAADTGGLSVGLGALGVSASNARLMPQVEGAIKTGATINAGGNVTVRALHNYDAAGNLLLNPDSSVRGAYAEADASGGGIIDGKGAVPTAISQPNVESLIGANAVVRAGQVTSIEAFAAHVASAKADALSIGIGVAVGASLPKADGNGTVRAVLDGAVSGGTDFRLLTLSHGKANTEGDASGGGVIAAMVPKAESVASPTVEAGIRNTASVDVTRDVIVEARSQGSARSDAFGLSLGVLAVGTMGSKAEVSPTVRGFIGNTTVKAGRHVRVSALHNATSSGPSAANEAVAVSEATKGGIVGGVGASPKALAVADVDSYLATGGTIDALGDVSIVARAANNARANAKAFAAGIVTVGASQADATASGSTRAHVDGRIVRGANLSILADSRDHAASTADASGGGLLDVNVPRSSSVIRPRTQAFVGNGTNTADIKLSGAVEVLADGTAFGSSEGVGSSGGLIGVGRMRAVTDVQPNISSYIASQSKVDAGKDLTLRSLMNYSNPTTVDAGKATAANTSATSSLSAAVDIESARSTATLSPTVLAEVKPSTTIRTGNDLAIVARSYHEVISDATGDAFGAVAVGTTNGVAEAAGSVRGLVSDPTSFVVGRHLVIETEQAGSALADSKGAAGGAIAGRESRASADAHPRVEAILNGGTAPLQVGGDATVRSFATFDVTAAAIGSSSGLGTVGVSWAKAQWRPEISAYLDTASVLQAGGNVAIQAYNNHTANGTKDTTRRVRANADSSIGSLLGDTGSDALAVVDAQTEAVVRPRASITGRNIDLISRSRNQADVDGDGTVLAAAALGSVLAAATFDNQTLAGTQAGTSANLTTLNASNDIRVLASTDNVMEVDAVGGVGGLLTRGAAQANAHLRSNQTEATIDNNSRIDAGSDLEIVAENRADLVADAYQVMGAAVTDNETLASVRIPDSQTVAEVGTGVKIKVDTFLQEARDRDVRAEAISYASAPFALGGTNKATSIVDVSPRALTQVAGGGTDIVACRKATFWAFADKVTTITEATTKTTGTTGNLISIVDNTKEVDADVVADAGAKVTTEQLVVDSGVPVANAADYQRRADTDANTVVQVVSVVVDTICTVVGEIISLWGVLGGPAEVCEDVVETFEEVLGADVDEIQRGSQSLNNSIDFNSQVVIKPCAKINPAVVINAAGVLQEANGSPVFDGQRQLRVGDTVQGTQVVVGPIRNAAPASVRFSARGGTLQGRPRIDFDAGFESVRIANASSKDLVLVDVEAFNRSQPEPALQLVAGNSSDFRYQLVATGIDTRVDVASTGTGNVILRGSIANPGGTTRINASRNIQVEGNVAEIVSRLLEVTSTGGSIGRAGQSLPVLIPATDAASMGAALASSGITSARGNSGVFLKLAGRSIEGRPVDLRIDQLVSPAGPVDIQIVDSESLSFDKAFKPVTSVIPGSAIVDNVVVGTQQSPQPLSIRTPPTSLSNDVRFGGNVVVTGQLAIRGELQLGLGGGTAPRFGSLNLAEGSRLKLAAQSGLGQRGETSRTLIGPGQRSGQFSSLPAVGTEIGFGVFLSRFRDTNTPIRYGNDGRVEVALFQAGPGDANGDGNFDSSDLVAVFTSGIYETGKRGTWLKGDWDGNGFFDTSDLIAAFMTGDYERPPAAAVPVANAPENELSAEAISTAATDLLLSAWQATTAVDDDPRRKQRSDRWLPALEIAWAEVEAAAHEAHVPDGCEDLGGSGA